MRIEHPTNTISFAINKHFGYNMKEKLIKSRMPLKFRNEKLIQVSVEQKKIQTQQISIGLFKIINFIVLEKRMLKLYN